MMLRREFINGLIKTAVGVGALVVLPQTADKPRARARMVTITLPGVTQEQWDAYRRKRAVTRSEARRILYA